jgi:signal transduction histidine kinase
MATTAHSALPQSELLGDAALAATVFAASLGLAIAGDDGHSAAGGLALALTALASLPLVARRSSPLAVFVLTALASTALYAVARPAGPPLGPTFALYFVAAAGLPRERARLVLGVAAVLLLAHAGAATVSDPTFPGTALAFGVAVWGGALLAGDRTRLRHERMDELEQRALRAEREAQRERRLAAAEERMRIARDLHDSAGHAINVILVHAGLGRLRAGSDSATREAFLTIEEVARDTVADIDQLVAALRDDDARTDVEPPPGLAALDTLLRRHRAAGLDLISHVRGEPRSLPRRVDRGAYRIVQEALTNAARHGTGAAELELTFTPDALAIAVVNPVAGAADAGSGHGLVGMRERADLLGGDLRTTLSDGRFRLDARLPLRP